MVISLFIVVTIALIVSFVCSLMEAAIFSVPLPYVKYLADKGSKSGKILLNFKENMGIPIAAILILNTISHTLGASIGGAMVAEVSESAVIVFSLVFTLLVLILSEIIPKQLGTVYARNSSVLVALPLKFIITAIYPLVWLTQLFSKRIGHNNEEPLVSHQEVLTMAEMGHEEGVIDVFEDSVIRNIIGLDRVLVKDILTPRVVVFSLKETTRVGEIEKKVLDFPHTRIPLFSIEDPDSVKGYVTQRDISRYLLEGDKDKQLKDFSRTIATVPDVMRADKLMLQMVENHEPICSVVNEHGGFAGVVTLEDLLEEIIGREIVDEFDTVRDLRTYAKTLHELSGKA
jgi:CBS domain containing-hemolysin-like protein